MIRYLTSLLVPRAKPVEHPFVKVQREREPHGQDEDVEEEESGYEETSWGEGRVVNAKATFDEDGFEFELSDLKNRLKPIPLDIFDLDVLTAWNRANPDKEIIRANYKLLKPYIISQKVHGMNYKGIGAVLNYSESWVQRIAPRIKEAARNRAKALPHHKEGG